MQSPPQTLEPESTSQRDDPALAKETLPPSLPPSLLFYTRQARLADLTDESPYSFRVFPVADKPLALPLHYLGRSLFDEAIVL